MSGVTVIVVITLAVITLLVVVATVRVVAVHLRNLAAAVTTMRDEVQPELARLQRAADVARAELERVSETNDRRLAHRRAPSGPEST
jgi:predicted PurR-regulated permease PerM